MVMNLLLVSFTPEQKDLMLLYQNEEGLEELIKFAVGILLGQEIGRLDLNIQQFIDSAKWETLALRFHQHNVRIIHKYYSKISMRRFAELI